MVWNLYSLWRGNSVDVLNVKLPNKLSANTPESVLINQLIDYLKSLTPARSNTAQISHTPFGVIHRASSPSSSSSTGLNWQGEYDPTITYNIGDVVIISMGANAGTYVCNTSCLGQSPWLGGGYWIQWPGGNGNWL